MAIAADMTWLRDAVVYLGAVVVVAPLCARIGTSPILGYLLAGVALGPHAFGVIQDMEGARALAGFGVVLLMFSIGLELSFQRLRIMARQVFGFGFAQVALTATGVYLAGRALGLGFEAALLVGGALSLSRPPWWCASWRSGASCSRSLAGSSSPPCCSRTWRRRRCWRRRR